MIQLKRTLALVLVAGASAVGATPAVAADAGVTDGVLTFTGTPGAGSDLLVVPSAGGVSVFDLAQDASALPGCERTEDALLCSGASSLVLAFGSGDDSAVVDAEIALPATIDGGAGSDSLSAGTGPTTLRGGTQDDLLSGGEAADTIDGGAGADYVLGAGGDDRITATDGEIDSITCGDGNDVVSADRDDVVDPDCETRSGPPAAGGPAAPQNPGMPGGTVDDGTPAAPGPGVAPPSPVTPQAPASRRPQRERASCSPAGRNVVCTVQFRSRSVSGVVLVTLRRGGRIVAVGRSVVIAGRARAILRPRGKVRKGRHTLRASVRSVDRRTTRRSFGIFLPMS